MTGKEDQQGALSPYVALRPLKFGEVTVQPGQPVPVQPGRDYQMMLRRGEISVTAHPQAQAVSHSLPTPQVEAGNKEQPLALKTGPAFFVSEDGASSRVMVLKFAQADPEDAEELGVPVGSPVAEVVFEDAEPEELPSIVPVTSLLPLSPTDRLIADLQGVESSSSLALEAADYGFSVGEAVYVVSNGQVTEGTVKGFERVTKDSADLLAAGFSVGEAAVTIEAGEEVERYSVAELLPHDLADQLLSAVGEAQAPAEADPAAAAEVEHLKTQLAEVQAERDFARLLVEAATAEGDPLPEDMPSRATLLKAHLATLPGVVMLAQGSQGVSNLAALDGIAEKSAQRVIDYLLKHDHLKPEQQQPAEEQGA